jgi:hypothetical protein
MNQIDNDIKSLYVWFSPDFYEGFIYNLFNYLIILISLLYFLKKKKININYFKILAFCSLTPFILNNVIFDWHQFPDQSKYLNQSRELRNSFLFLYDEHVKFKINYFYASTFFFNLETFASIGFINRFCYNLLIIFLINKKSVNNISTFVLLFCPSIIFHSSISLKDICIFILNIIYLYFLIKNKIKYRFCSLLLILFLLFNLGIEIFLLTIFLTLIYLLYKNKLNFFLFLFLFIIFYILNLYIFNLDFISILNNKRAGYFVENFGLYKDSFSPIVYERFYDLNNLNFLIIIQLLKQFLYFIFAPLVFTKLNLFNLILYIDLIFILVTLFACYIKLRNYNKKIFFFWVFIILINSFIYSLFIFNEGTMFRYRYAILVYSIFAMNLELINRKGS